MILSIAGRYPFFMGLIDETPVVVAFLEWVSREDPELRCKFEYDEARDRHEICVDFEDREALDGFMTAFYASEVAAMMKAEDEAV